MIIIGIDHDTVCAGVVCAASPGIARVGPAVARPLAAAPAGPTSAVPGVAAQTTTAQTLFYHENEAIFNHKSRDDLNDEPPCWKALAGNAIVMMKASIDTVSEQ